MAKKYDAIDVEVGSRIRLRREELSITQDILAEKLCISPQQLEKYECGVEKIGAGRLLSISEILGVPVMFFFRSASDDALPSMEAMSGFRLAKHHRAALQTALSGIEDKRLRARIVAFVQSSEPDNER
ncbi:helix-turn-helix transcriptional regulator [Rhizobium sp. P40RR-XXII]|uniref:helix-turn-helix domain-containing protein n=1 Tax=unclassified Rhizobium TaxID=2613769 RepID=UPI00145781CB|nr:MULTISPECIES: helix-turn-helix transcriptional regulator [unclassified Rhizobium]NLR84670.1 helix-turn-helix transcriptional regulator [Rhizobium sp. P28RR-XV]NLS16423.1 helix-turn-helix transcriptional regulator [Rhizobium sp. P40RR-XXII]